MAWATTVPARDGQQNELREFCGGKKSACTLFVLDSKLGALPSHEARQREPGPGTEERDGATRVEGEDSPAAKPIISCGLFRKSPPVYRSRHARISIQ